MIASAFARESDISAALNRHEFWRTRRRPRWRCSFLDELLLDVGRRRRLRQRNIFRRGVDSGGANVASMTCGG